MFNVIFRGTRRGALLTIWVFFVWWFFKQNGGSISSDIRTNSRASTRENELLFRKGQNFSWNLKMSKKPFMNTNLYTWPIEFVLLQVVIEGHKVTVIFRYINMIFIGCSHKQISLSNNIPTEGPLEFSGARKSGTKSCSL